MVFSKYLFSIIVGLTGSINAWAFSTSEGITNRKLEGFNKNLDSLSDKNDDLIQKEHTRLDAEKKKSEEDFIKLETSNNSTKEKSKMRQQSGDGLMKVNYELAMSRAQQSIELSNSSKKLSKTLSDATSKFKTELESKVTEYHTKLKKSVEEESQKLTDALKNLQESNAKLIETVRENINQMPNKLFEFSDESARAETPKS